jgi:hypothetical protein
MQGPHSTSRVSAPSRPSRLPFWESEANASPVAPQPRHP